MFEARKEGVAKFFLEFTRGTVGVEKGIAAVVCTLISALPWARLRGEGESLTFMFATRYSVMVGRHSWVSDTAHDPFS
jgi:hypothetical protein